MQCGFFKKSVNRCAAAFWRIKSLTTAAEDSWDQSVIEVLRIHRLIGRQC